MSDYHIMDGDPHGDGAIYSVAFHFSVPDEANLAGVNLRTALSQDAEQSKDSRVPWLSQGHKSQLTDGEIYEVVKPYRRDPNNSLIQDRAELDAQHTALVATVQDRLRDKYRFWGYDRDVP